MYRPQRTTVGYRIDTRSMTVGLLQYKREEAVEVIEPWLTSSTFTLLQGAILCGKLESVSTCNRWIRPYFFSVQNTIRAALTSKWKKVQGYYTRMGIDKAKAKYGLPKNLERCLIPLIAREKALLLWHSKSTFDTPPPRYSKTSPLSRVGYATQQSSGNDPSHTGFPVIQPSSPLATPARSPVAPCPTLSNSGSTYTGPSAFDADANCFLATPASSTSIV